MMLTGTDIQHNPLRDFVTPRNPTSEYGFLSYLKANDRLLDFLNLDLPFPPRSEYSSYVSWVASKFNDVVFYDNNIDDIYLINEESENPLVCIKSSNQTWYAKNISIAIGRSENIPNNSPKIGH